MPFVVIGAFIHLAIPVLEQEPDIKLIKRKGPKGYFYYSGDLDKNTLFRKVKKILATKLSYIYVFETYSLYNGMMDISDYLSDERKNANPYYQNPKKELSDQEVVDFKAANGLN